MKLVRFFIIGIVFGIVLTKSEVISWFRIQEMFRFHSFHMYGVIGSAVVCGVILLQLARKFKVKNIEGEQLGFKPKDKGMYRLLIGGSIFGLGWAMTGSCPGPIYILIGYGYSPFIVVLLSADFGTFCYGVIKNKLPH